MSSDCIRFADYFFECGFKLNANLAESIVKELTDVEESEQVNVAERNSHTEDENCEHTGSKMKHPMENKFKPEINTRYPLEDYSDKEKLPSYLSMFCFPNDMTLNNSEGGPPPAQFHSFLITEDNGNKLYGVTVTVYEKLRRPLAIQLESMISVWRENHLISSDLEYLQHIQSQLALYQESILKYNRGIFESNVDAQDVAQLLADAEEKVLLFTDLLDPIKNTILVDIENVYEAKCIGVISHWPWHDLLKDWLCALIHLSKGEFNGSYGPIERYIVNLIHEIPLPPPGKLEVSISIGELKLYCSRPPVNAIPLLQNFSLYPFFRALSLQNILTVFELALAERKILFLSSHYSMLAYATESLCLLLYPLHWQHILIPILPAKLISYLQAPLPYIIGMSKDCFDVRKLEEFNVLDIAIVDLDSNEILLKESPMPLPIKERKKMLARLQRYSPQIHTSQKMIGSPSAKHNTPKKITQIPITAKEAFPHGKLIPRTCVSIVQKAKTEDESLNALSSSALNLSKIFVEGSVKIKESNIGNNFFNKMTSTKNHARDANSESSSPMHQLPKKNTSRDKVWEDLSNSSISGSDSRSSSHKDSSLIRRSTPQKNDGNSSSSREYMNKLDERRPSRAKSFDTSKSSLTSEGYESLKKRNTGPSLKASRNRGFSKESSSVPSTATASMFSTTRFTTVPEKDAIHNHNSTRKDGGHQLEAIRIDEVSRSNSSFHVSKHLDIESSDGSIMSVQERASVPNLGYPARCSFCTENLNNSGSTILKCSGCNIYIHYSCFEFVDGMPCPKFFKEKKIQLTFFKIFTSLLKNYRSFLKKGATNNLELLYDDIQDVGDDWFDKSGFINSTEKDSKAFVSQFIETQAFSQFTLERIINPESDFEVLFFDESVKAKKNRSKFKFSKETTPFLEDKVYKTSQVIESVAPNLINLESDENYTSSFFPITLNPKYLVKPKTIKPLITKSDQQIMKSRASELVQRARNAALNKRRKQDFSKWMNSKWKYFQKIGEGEVVALGFLPDEQRRELFEERISQVSETIDKYEVAHISTLDYLAVRKALTVLHSQNLILMHATDEEQLVDSNDQEELQNIYTRLFRVITIYEDYQSSLPVSSKLSLSEIKEPGFTMSFSDLHSKMGKESVDPAASRRGFGR